MISAGFCGSSLESGFAREIAAQQVLKELGYGLEASAMKDIATRWRFEPGTRDGIPVDVYLNIKITFHLKD